MACPGLGHKLSSLCITEFLFTKLRRLITLPVRCLANPGMPPILFAYKRGYFDNAMVLLAILLEQVAVLRSTLDVL